MPVGNIMLSTHSSLGVKGGVGHRMVPRGWGKVQEYFSGVKGLAYM